MKVYCKNCKRFNPENFSEELIRNAKVCWFTGYIDDPIIGKRMISEYQSHRFKNSQNNCKDYIENKSIIRRFIEVLTGIK